jgi:hypothetical protein
MMWEERKVKLQNGECEELFSPCAIATVRTAAVIVSHVICTCLGNW